MRKNIALAIILLFTLTILAGCEKDVLSPNLNGDFTFNVGPTEFTYTPGSRTGTMFIHNPTDIRIRVNVKICDSRCDERQGVWVTVREHETESYDEQYRWHERLAIEIHRDGMKTNNIVTLGE